MWSAFLTLTDSRSIGMTAGPIPLTEIEAYFRLYRVEDPDLVDDWLYLIRALDHEYLSYQHEKQDK